MPLRDWLFMPSLSRDVRIGYNIFAEFFEPSLTGVETGRNNRTEHLVKKSKERLSVGIKRVYEPVTAEDGLRVLVDRVWPRGVSKQSAHIKTWLKKLAPTTTLRKWFGHDPQRWEEFQKRYHR